MHYLVKQISKNPYYVFRLVYSMQNYVLMASQKHCSNNVYGFDICAKELLQGYQSRVNTNIFATSDYSVRYFVGDNKQIDINNMTLVELDNLISILLVKNKDTEIEKIIHECTKIRKTITEASVKKLFRHYCKLGKVEMVKLIQNHYLRFNLNIFKRNGEYMHYLAKAQCYKGNSDKGLAILKESYIKYPQFRGYYRQVMRELIQDSVLNRSEASLVIFRRYVIEFSKEFSDHYPLVCLWHMCWSSNWFSDQIVSEELLDSSEALRIIIKEKAIAFSLTILKNEYNEDAVLRLLQLMLKHGMLGEYAKVLQVLFNYKLNNHDIRGCTEILRNCDVLGINLPSDQQGKYIKLLIRGSQPADKPVKKPAFKDFKLKF